MPAHRRVLFAVFVLSGFTGLIYESLWTHYLKLFLGHAAFAQSLVLAIFMGGMALGGWLASRFTERWPNLLRAYAAAEAAIGLYALAFHALFGLLEDASYRHAFPALSSPLAVDLLQWGIAVALLLPPSVVLGATFPLMSGAVIRRWPGTDGSHLAMLYFSNSIGAAAGALAATFWLIGWLGLPGTLALGGAINLLIALAVAAIARQPETLPSAAPAPRPDPGPAPGPTEAAARPAPPAADDADRHRLARAFLVAAFVTGAASFIYEVAWIRMLSLVLGSSFHAFELMLSAFITGLALGSLAIRRHIDRLRNPLAAAAWIQIAMGLMAIATLPVYAQSFDWMAAMIKALPRDEAGWQQFNLLSHGIAFAVMLPATLLAGMTLPLFTHVLLRAGHGERSIGRIYAANSLGAIAGVMFAIHVGLPRTGLALTLATGAMADVALGLLLLQMAGATPRWRLAALAAIVVPITVVRLVPLDPRVLSSGVYRSGDAHPEKTQTLFHQDGKTATISVIRFEGSIASLRTNGKADAAIRFDPSRAPAPDEVTMVLLGALPLSLHPDARTVANIGFGSGLTTHVLLGSPTVAEVSTVEIEPAVVEASRVFKARVGRAYDDPRSRIHLEDAKSWFARSGRRFDIIVSEPSNPWVSGVSSLFSDEFYRRVAPYLADGGLLVQWLHLYEFDARLVASVIKALDRNFADWSIYDIDGLDIMIIASRSGRVPMPSERVFAMPALAQDMAHVGLRRIDDLRVRWIGSKHDLGPWQRALPAPMNSDFAPYVELNAPRSRFFNTSAFELPSLLISRVPLVEMLAPATLAWTADAVSRGTGRLEFIGAAREIRAALLGQAGTPERIGREALEDRQRLADCATLATPDGLRRLHGLATSTLAFLDRRALAPLWADPSWLGCPRAQWSADPLRWLALYRAVAERDAAAMRTAGLAALADTGADEERRRWALLATLLALRVAGDDAALQALWQQQRPLLHAKGGIGHDVAMLVAPR